MTEGKSLACPGPHLAGGGGALVSMSSDAMLALTLVFQLCSEQRPALRDAAVNVRLISRAECFHQADAGPRARLLFRAAFH